MKYKYVLLTRRITNVGGAEIYTRNKVKYLKELGYDVTVVSACYGVVYIEDLKCFSDLVFPELLYSPFCFTAYERKLVINKIIKKLGLKQNIGKIIFETHSIELACWGELLSRELRGVNYAFLVDGTFSYLKSKTDDFMEFKLSKNQIACTFEKSFNELFNGKYSYYDHVLPFYCGNSVEDLERSYIKDVDFSKYYLTIGSITRLEKGFVEILIDEIRKLCEENKSKRFLLCFFGGTANKKYERKLISKITSIKNLDYRITNFLYPIPKNDLCKFDIFVTGGVFRTTSNYCLPTLSVDSESCKPEVFRQAINLFYPRSDSFVDYNCPWNCVSDFMRDVYINKTVVLPSFNKEDFITDSTRIDYNTHIDFINKTINSDEDYYDFSEYKKTISKKNKIVLSLLNFFLKEKAFYKVTNLIQKLR